MFDFKINLNIKTFKDKQLIVAYPNKSIQLKIDFQKITKHIYLYLF